MNFASGYCNQSTVSPSKILLAIPEWRRLCEPNDICSVNNQQFTGTAHRHFCHAWCTRWLLAHQYFAPSSSYGNVYQSVWINGFTRWLKAISIPIVTATFLARPFIKQRIPSLTVFLRSRMTDSYTLCPAYSPPLIIGWVWSGTSRPITIRQWTV